MFQHANKYAPCVPVLRIMSSRQNHDCLTVVYCWLFLLHLAKYKPSMSVLLLMSSLLEIMNINV
jgi:hypothetical protein